MATKTWNNSTGAYENAAAWSPVGVPTTGDTAFINAGTVSVSSALPTGLTFYLQKVGAGSPTLALNNTGLPSGSLIAADNNSSHVSVQAIGASYNAGVINVVNGGSGEIAIVDASNGAVGQFVNSGTISFIGALLPDIVYSGGNAAGGLVNNGLITLSNGYGFTTDLVLNANVSGTGQFLLDLHDFVELGNSVSSGQTFVFNQSASNSGLVIRNGSTFQGNIANFVASDTISFGGAAWDTRSFSQNGGIATYTFSSAGNVVAQIKLEGTGYTDANVTSTESGTGTPGQTATTIQTTFGAAPARIAYTDPTTGVSGTDPGIPYSDPNVPFLQYAYLWASPDGAAIRGLVPNMFIHGGSGDDAIEVTSGSNVLDGGPGSNFLTGGTGADGGHDTFFVDGRGGQVTYSTIVHFHPGDEATIFGFVGGVSTADWEPQGGVQGFTGATLHSALSGPGTTVNASMTFAGISITEASAHFQFTAGNNGGEPFLLVHYA